MVNNQVNILMFIFKVIVKPNTLDIKLTYTQTLLILVVDIVPSVKSNHIIVMKSGLIPISQITLHITNWYLSLSLKEMPRTGEMHALELAMLKHHVFYGIQCNLKASEGK